MAIPTAFTEARDKLQRTRQQGDRATQSVQRKRYAPLADVVQFRRKGHVRQQITKSPQRVHWSEEREHEPQEFRQEFHVGLFCHVSSRNFSLPFLRSILLTPLTRCRTCGGRAAI